MMAGVAVPTAGSRPLKSALRKSSTLPRPHKRQVVIDEARNTYCEATSYGGDAFTLPRLRRPNPSPLTETLSSGVGGVASWRFSPVSCASDPGSAADPSSVRKCPSPQTLVTALLTDSLRAITPPDQSRRDLRHPWRPNLPDLVPGGGVTECAERVNKEHSPPPPPPVEPSGKDAAGSERSGGGPAQSQTAAPAASSRSVGDEQVSDMSPKTTGAAYECTTDASPQTEAQTVAQAQEPEPDAAVCSSVDSEFLSPEAGSPLVADKCLDVTPSDAAVTSAISVEADDTDDDDDGTNLDDPELPVLPSRDDSLDSRNPLLARSSPSHSAASSRETSPLGVAAPTVPQPGGTEQAPAADPPARPVSPASDEEDSYSLDDIEAALDVVSAPEASSAANIGQITTDSQVAGIRQQVTSQGDGLPPSLPAQSSGGVTFDNGGQSPSYDVHSPSYSVDYSQEELPSLAEEGTVEEELAGFVAGQAARTERLRRRYAAGLRRRGLSGTPNTARWSWTGSPDQGPPGVQKITSQQPAYRPQQQQQQQQQESPVYSAAPRRPVPLSQSREQQLRQLQMLQRRLGGPPPALTVGFPRQPHSWRSTEWLCGTGSSPVTLAPPPPRRFDSEFALQPGYYGTSQARHKAVFDPQYAMYEPVYEPVYAQSYSQRPGSRSQCWEYGDYCLSPASRQTPLWRGREAPPQAPPARGRSVTQSGPVWPPPVPSITAQPAPHVAAALAPPIAMVPPAGDLRRPAEADV